MENIEKEKQEALENVRKTATDAAVVVVGAVEEKVTEMAKKNLKVYFQKKKPKQ